MVVFFSPTTTKKNLLRKTYTHEVYALALGLVKVFYLEKPDMREIPMGKSEHLSELFPRVYAAVYYLQYSQSGSFLFFITL